MDALDYYRKAQASSGSERWEALANVDYLLGRLDVRAARQVGLEVEAAPPEDKGERT